MHRVLEKIKRAASGYLFVGPPDSSKLEDALEFAARRGCNKIDLVRVAPDGASIKIDQIRDLQGRIRYGPAAGDHLFVVVERADEMTDEAAGAFLKTLEEPPARVSFILLLEREDRLPSTIASRCQKIIFGERAGGWAPKPELLPFYRELDAVRGKAVPQLLEFSAGLEKEKERIEFLLYELVYYAKEKLGDLRIARILLDAVRNVKKKANLKLALEVACLRMGEA